MDGKYAAGTVAVSRNIRKENWRRVQESNLPDPKVSPR